MDEPSDTNLSRRERQIMDIVYGLREASATQVLEAMSDPPTRTAVRTLLRILEQKGQLKHVKRSREFIYQPVYPRKRVAQSALKRVLNTFFDGSLEGAVAQHLSDSGTKVSEAELKRLAELIRQARK
jgi:BlaI family transcriptional regulator, penicillinase repressor